MQEQYFARFVTEEEYKKCLKTRKALVSHPDRFYLMIEPIRYFDSKSFYAYFQYKHPHLYDLKESDWSVLKKEDLRTVVPLIEYTQNHKPFYITFEGITFYKVMDIRIDKSQQLVFTLHQKVDDIYVEVNHGFMIMPFGSKLDVFFKENIRDYLKGEMNIDIYRADDFNDNDIIVDTIYREIEKAEFIICEVSNCNKNVFFEIGYAKALNKELIFLLQRGIEHKFFDVAHIRRIDYDVDSAIELQERLKDTIETIRGRR